VRPEESPSSPDPRPSIPGDGPPLGNRPSWKKRLGPIGVVLAFLAKFKTAALILLTKGKFLLLGPY
jgi:hypothetical protein